MTMKKTVYFVRHGESEGNISPVGNLNHSPLSEKGREQAEFLAKRCAGLSIQALITSTLERAEETGRIIASSLGIAAESSDLFVERRKPSEVFGQPQDSEHIHAIWRSLWDNFDKPGFRHSDEENFDDLKVRAKKALEYLMARPEGSILAVTHGIFLRIMAAYAVMGDELDGRECARFMSRLETGNTGLSVFRHDSEDPFGRIWQISAWNDHAHLGE